MRRTLLALLAVPLAGAAAFAALRLAGAEPVPSAAVKLGNATCPVLGKPVDPKVTRVWQGVEIAFCCSDCPGKFVSDPTKYTPALLKDVAAQLSDTKARLAKYEPASPSEAAPSGGATTADAGPVDIGNPVCPVMGGKTKPNVTAEYHGMLVRFCCPGCEGRFLSSPDAYLKKIKAQNPDLAKKIDAAEAAWAKSHR